MKTKTDLRLQFHRETGKRAIICELKEGDAYLNKADIEYINWLEENLLKNEKVLEKFLNQMNESYSAEDTKYVMACAAMDLKRELEK